MTNPLERAVNSPKYLLGAGLVFVVVVVAIFMVLRSVQSSDGGAGELVTNAATTDSAADGQTDTPTAASEGGQSSSVGGQQEASGGNEGGRAGFDPDRRSSDPDPENPDEPSQPDDNGADGDDGDDGDAGDTEDGDDPAGAADNDDPCDQTTSRRNFEIRFAPGTSEGNYTNRMEEGGIDRYSIDVRANQIMDIRVVSTAGRPLGDSGFSLISPTGTAVATNVASRAELTEQGTYQICVAAVGGPLDYSLVVSVIDDNSPTKTSAEWCGTSVNDRGDITFDQGASSGSATNSVIRGERDLYRFGASKDQETTLRISALEDNAEFLVRTPSGATLADGTRFDGQLPESGEYEVCIGGTRGNATYILNLTIR